MQPRSSFWDSLARLFESSRSSTSAWLCRWMALVWVMWVLPGPACQIYIHNTLWLFIYHYWIHSTSAGLHCAFRPLCIGLPNHTTFYYIHRLLSEIRLLLGMKFPQTAKTDDVRRMKRRTRAHDPGIFPVTFFSGFYAQSAGAPVVLRACSSVLQLNRGRSPAGASYSSLNRFQFLENRARAVMMASEVRSMSSVRAA